MSPQSIIPLAKIERTILSIRGQRVMLDSDLAEMFNVTTKALNQAIKRNAERFPTPFMFRLTAAEKYEVVTNCDHLAKLKFSRSNPLAFTEHGVLMAATVLNSPRAVQMSVAIIQTFVRLRELLASNAALARKLADLERRYDAQFKSVFDAIRQLMANPSETPKPKIGYTTEEQLRNARALRNRS
jgi:phage regulator Rha-like protein